MLGTHQQHHSLGHSALQLTRNCSFVFIGLKPGLWFSIYKPYCCFCCCAIESTQFPTLSYGLAEGRGDALSTSNGAWGTLEFGYNPLSNNLGTSISSGTTDSLNVGANERIGSADPKSK